MLKVYITQDNGENSPRKGRHYAYADNNSPIDIDGLAEHMAEHNSGFSRGMLKGILTEAVACIRHLALSGQPVKLDNLAIFYCHIENKGGWKDLKDVNLSIGGENDNIQSIRLCARATGDFTKSELTKDGTIELNRESRRLVQAARRAAGMPVDDDSVDPAAGGTNDSGTSESTGDDNNDDDNVIS